MNITILAVGKIKEGYLREGIKEYEKRLKPYCTLRIIEVEEERSQDEPGPAEKEKVLKREGERILGKVPRQGFKIALCIEGERFSSEGMASKIEELALRGISDITFIIGGSLGLSDEVKKVCDIKLSFSDFTLPHQLMRLLLLEQIYRWFKIIRGEPYHK
ncbi:23S rRNA (pseudouridine1915-N3)-methyltransferase [Caldanaerovirga acetigignens]|jgi:23S rRNA (pseudouridine1915-N3)-methyltransferase|uniref:Ribosomal RNA large subunit methyltransferase H n=1 Tax=Caldanaerovirga acetigignens TaxID=447595 RepID=A0A1M7GLA3_9FIRM|nr:23S rRNA (pseudouridine(1915)-N(3))-methyltransferase RlmH [Caldanaerovirga acetigignens]SHM16945.1 23S rRNA (pseudouridine1915-N3)-methyltransferase [Caldanaerovirga acetigignens]